MITKLLNFFKSKPINEKPTKKKAQIKNIPDDKSIRKGELGEYKVNIQLDQMPKEYKHLTDLLITNLKAKSGFSQIDHVLLTPYVHFIIETKNYSGEIKGRREDKQWSVNKKFKMMNPFYQNFGHVESVLKLINLGREDIVSLVSFTRRCTFSVDPELRKIGSNELIVYDIELTEFIERKISRIKQMKNGPLFTMEQIESMYTALIHANITDPEIRKSHVEGLRGNRNNAGQSEDSCEVKCAKCGKSVPDEVKKYCLSNQSRFKGKVYCFDHQNSI